LIEDLELALDLFYFDIEGENERTLQTRRLFVGKYVRMKVI